MEKHNGSCVFKRKLRMGMIGGGSDAFIGAIHRCAAFIDNQIELVCGCFSIDPKISLESGRSYYLPDSRIYTSYQEMFEQEALLPEGERMDFVTIVTPNFLHYAPAVMALENGFHVVLDKPITFSLEEAKALKVKIDETGLILALTHVYSAYPAVKEMKQRIKEGQVGKIRKILVEYPQGWLSTRMELQQGSNAGWRTDPKRSGKAGSIGDIGTHAMHLAEYVSGLHCTELCAELSTFCEGRMLDDDGAALLRFNNGAKGELIATQIAAGEANGLKLRIYGEKCGLEWRQMDPTVLRLKWQDKPEELIRVGSSYMSDLAKHNTRISAGHPEGFIEAFANIYRNFAYTVQAQMAGITPRPEWLDFPNVNDGIRGMQFIETMVKSGYDNREKWTQWVE